MQSKWLLTLRVDLGPVNEVRGATKGKLRQRSREQREKISLDQIQNIVYNGR